MNKIVKMAMAMEMDQFNKYHILPDVEIGDLVPIKEIWDGEGEEPDGSYGYQLTSTPNDNWINYCFEIVEEKENYLDTIVQITNIELL